MATPEELRDRARAGARGGPTDAELNQTLRAGGTRRVASTVALGPVSRVVAAGGHNAAQNSLKERYGVSESAARDIEGAGRFRRGAAVMAGAGAVAAVATGGLAVAPVAVAAVATLAYRSGANRRRDVAREQIAAAQQPSSQQMPAQQQLPQQVEQGQAVPLRTARDMHTPGGGGRGRGPSRVAA